jgi:DNA-binding LacI/PurR family transcriptional regulator
VWLAGFTDEVPSTAITMPLRVAAQDVAQIGQAVVHLAERQHPGHPGEDRGAEQPLVRQRAANLAHRS